MCSVRPVAGPDQIAVARELLREYAAGLGTDLAFQGFEQEVAGLPGAYAPPAGRLLLAWVDTAPAGCIAFRPLAGRSCELKRLYVRPAYRGRGLGERLARRAIDEARGAGYRHVRLDTLPTMLAAQALYRRLGFREGPPYYSTPIPGTTFFERALDPPRTVSVDLALRRWRDVGMAVLEANDAGVSACLVRPEQYGLRGAVDVDALAVLIDSLGSDVGASAVLIDGPQAWKAADNGLAHSRVAERVTRTQAKTGLPGACKPAAALGYVAASVRLFDALAERGWPRLGEARDGRVAVESFPTAAWRSLGLAPLPAKGRASDADLRGRLAQLQALIPLMLDREPTHDELQAVVSGIGGLALLRGDSSGYGLDGLPPVLVDGAWREGYILTARRPG